VTSNIVNLVNDALGRSDIPESPRALAPIGLSNADTAYTHEGSCARATMRLGHLCEFAQAARYIQGVEGQRPIKIALRHDVPVHVGSK
jgi:hypothetical protein